MYFMGRKKTLYIEVNMTDKNFKMSKTAKRLLMTTDDKQKKADLKNLFKQSESEYEVNKKRTAKSREKVED